MKILIMLWIVFCFTVFLIGYSNKTHNIGTVISAAKKDCESHHNLLQIDWYNLNPNAEDYYVAVCNDNFQFRYTYPR